jgi:ABC-type multidrug transport system permease subunit
MKTLVLAGGVHALAFVVFHLTFYWIFGWKRALPRLDFVNQRVYQILNLSITCAFAWIAYVSLAHADALVATPLGRAFTGGVAVFWAFRALQQLWFFRNLHPASLGLFGLFVTGAVLYAVPTLS